MDAADDAPEPAPRRRFALVASGVAVAVLALLLAASVLGGDGTDDAGAEPGGTATTLASAAIPNRAGEPDVDAMLDMALLTPADGETTLRDHLDGRPVLVNQWSKTCVPCIEEMPWLEEVSEANPGVRVLGVNNLDGLGAATSMAEQTGITYEWVRDPRGDFSHAARTVGLPDTMLFSADGRLLASKIGAFADRAAIQSFLDDHLDTDLDAEQPDGPATAPDGSS